MEAVQLLEKVNQLLADIELKITNIQKEAAGKGSSGDGLSLKQNLHIVNVLLMSMEKFSGSGTLSAMLNKIQQGVHAAYRAYYAAIQIHTAIAILNAENPIGWAEMGKLAMAGAATVTAGISMSNALSMNDVS
jgi:hypothetical protein